MDSAEPGMNRMSIDTGGGGEYLSPKSLIEELAKESFSWSFSIQSSYQSLLILCLCGIIGVYFLYVVHFGIQSVYDFFLRQFTVQYSHFSCLLL
jgi:hypothetical protein